MFSFFGYICNFPPLWLLIFFLSSFPSCFSSCYTSSLPPLLTYNTSFFSLIYLNIFSFPLFLSLSPAFSPWAKHTNKMSFLSSQRCLWSFLKLMQLSFRSLFFSVLSAEIIKTDRRVSLFTSPLSHCFLLKLPFSPSSLFPPLFNFFCKHMKINWASLLTFPGTFPLAALAPSRRNASHHLFISATSALIHYSAPVSVQSLSFIRLSPECIPQTH